MTPSLALRLQDDTAKYLQQCGQCRVTEASTVWSLESGQA